MAYTLIVSEERFDLTKEQLESDPDNYFTTYFFGSFSEASEGRKELVIAKEPALFRLIQAHLRGYKMLPIPDGYIPYMTKDVVLENLLQEAEYYALANLVKKIKDFQITNPPALTQRKYKFRSVLVSWLGEKLTEVYTRDLHEAEYHDLLSSGGARSWGECYGLLAMDRYADLWSWVDHTNETNKQYCAILVLDE